MVTGLRASSQVCIDNNLLRHNAFQRTYVAKEHARLNKLKGRFYYFNLCITLMQKIKRGKYIPIVIYSI